MTTEEWKKVESDLLMLDCSVKLHIDGYEVWLVPARENMRIYITRLKHLSDITRFVLCVEECIDFRRHK